MADVVVAGPFFDGTTSRSVVAACAEVEERLAQEAFDAVRSELHANLRHPTGRYESRVRIERQGDDLAVTDSGMVYGPWLEGTGSRNRTTRFKGYQSFRRATQRVEGKALNEADKVLDQRVIW